MSSGEINNFGIFISVIFTILFTSLLLFPIYFFYGDSFPIFDFISPWLYIPFSYLLYPVVGKIFSIIVEALCDANDNIYDTENGEWTAVGKLMFAIFWPITAPIMIVYSLVALVYGLLIKSLFDR